MSNHVVFVYGSLKRGYCNHDILGDAEYLGNGSIKGFDMYHVASFPGIVPGDGVVHGEFYRVDDDTLERLDSLEGYDPENPEDSMYVRQQVDGAWLYVWNRGIDPVTEPHEPSGIWEGKQEGV